MLVAEVGPAPRNLVSFNQPHVVPIELRVVTNQLVTPLERAWTCVGTSEQSWFEWIWKPVTILSALPSSVGTAPVMLFL